MKLHFMKVKHIFFILIFTSLVSCNRETPIIELRTFVEFTVPAGLSTIESHFFVSENTPIPFELQLQNASLDTSAVDLLVAGTGFLRPAVGRDTDLGFIRSVNVFLVEENGRRNELLFLDFVPIGEKQEISLLNSIVDIKDRFMDDRATIETRLEFNTPPPTTTDLRLDMTFAVFGE
jgi:hypothetical protein